MDKWKNSVVIVIGANSGVGLAILKKLAQSGLKVVGFDIKLDAIEKLKVELKNAKIYSWACDITKDDITEASFQWVEKNVGSIDILINCAGQHKSINTLSQQNSMAEIISHIDVNYIAVIRCIRLAFKYMEARDTHGYIVNVNCNSSTNIAVKATLDAMRAELNQLRNRKVRITNLSPGDEFDNLSFDNPNIKPAHIGDIIFYLLTIPYEVSVTNMQLKAT
ncbi:hypothetical protein PVAND_014052 [Polypedilum vanderplanki]|uniref:Uncharacterized protein n=1 Tax=Polypedilum vanderplanki TaxID=319348 RepID=A0A9J6CRL2_POLVA|nr:hypothetical protein PVAND_014052 [Polypedilum vanderplanki]